MGKPGQGANGTAGCFRHRRRAHSLALLLVSLMILLSLLANLWFISHFSNLWPKGYAESTHLLANNPDLLKGTCAINLYGLPRSFKDLTLPSLIKNVIEPNARYSCDYFVHYYDRQQELMDRGVDKGRGGRLNTEEIRLLETEGLAGYNVTVRFAVDTEEEFFARYDSLLCKILSDPWYLPIEADSHFTNSTISNIIMMLHSQESVWTLMQSERETKQYNRVAMLRSDVLFVTPIDIYRLPDGSIDVENKHAVIPNFANHPSNDRFFAGPADATQIWAAGRLERLDAHVEKMRSLGRRIGIHSESLLKYTIFPAIQDANFKILPDDDICFLRVRPDCSIRFSDCSYRLASENNKLAIESLIHRRCNLTRSSSHWDVVSLECNDKVNNETNLTAAPFEEYIWKVPAPKRKGPLRFMSALFGL